MPEMTEAERRWESWFDAYLEVVSAWPEPVEVSCPDGDGGRIRLAYLGFPGSRTGSVKVWCDKGLNGIFLGRVGIPEGAEVIPFGAPPEERHGIPEIELIPEAMCTREE